MNSLARLGSFLWSFLVVSWKLVTTIGMRFLHHSSQSHIRDFARYLEEHGCTGGLGLLASYLDDDEFGMVAS